MAYQIDFNDGSAIAGLDSDSLKARIDALLTSQANRHRRLWAYYRNPMLPRSVERDEQGADKPYRQAQEWGLPSRVTGVRVGDGTGGGQIVEGVARKEVVIENDIAWRIDAMIDFLFGQPIAIRSNVADESRKTQIETLLSGIIAHNGGGGLYQHAALLGAVHGFVDVLVKLDADRASAIARENAALSEIAQTIRLELIEPARALPILAEDDWRDVRAYVQVYQLPRPAASPRTSSRATLLQRLFRSRDAFADEQKRTIVEVLTRDSWQRFEDEKLVASGINSLGEIPLAHIQNIAMPFEYTGGSDVEPLIPLQDELNTRLSDRANRITMQCFKMYLGKGIDGFTEVPIAPGRMWTTDNNDADVIEFGGDTDSPSEDRHITELRESLDKTSGVTPIAAGAIRNRVGNLTSAAALRVTMMALIAKTQRKQLTYGTAIARICQLSLAWLDKAGLFPTTPDERQVAIEWPDTLGKFFD